MELKFRDIRKIISKIDRVSICMRETLEYDNYTYVKDVPERYNDFYVYGIGRICSEFRIDESLGAFDVKGNEINEEYFMGQCIEIMLSEKPREDLADDKR